MSTALSNSIGRLGKSLEEHKKGAVPMDVRHDQLVVYKYQARTQMDPEALRELAESIKELGILAPLLVRPLGGDKYEIIAGERRWVAAGMAGLVWLPILVKALDDETVDKIHLAENIQRENLSTIDLAARVQKDLAEAGGNMATVAKKYGKQKSWVSKIASIAQGGELMTGLVVDSVTADRAVLASVASLERKDKPAAQKLVKAIREAPAKANKREIATRHMADVKKTVAQGSATKGKDKVTRPLPGIKPTADELHAPAPGWRARELAAVDRDKTLLIVELSPVSAYAPEYKTLKDQFGDARLSQSKKHPDANYAVVEYGGLARAVRVYRADELRLLKVS